MVKMRWLVSVAGEGFERQPGDITDEPEAMAAAWGDGERAVRIEREEPRETAAAQPAENAARRTRRSR